LAWGGITVRPLRYSARYLPDRKSRLESISQTLCRPGHVVLARAILDPLAMAADVRRGAVGRDLVPLTQRVRCAPSVVGHDRTAPFRCTVTDGAVSRGVHPGSHVRGIRLSQRLSVPG